MTPEAQSWYVCEANGDPSCARRIHAQDAQRAAEGWGDLHTSTDPDYHILIGWTPMVAVWLDSPEATAEIEWTGEIPSTATSWRVSGESIDVYTAERVDR